MMSMHTHKFTAEEAATLHDAIAGIQRARQKAAGRERYELDADEEKELAAIGMIQPGNEIELDSMTWRWLSVLLDTWMSDAPVRMYGPIFWLSGVIQNLIDQEPERVVPYQRETRSQAVPVAVPDVPAGCLF